MCGRFSQSMTREDYLSLLADEADRDIAYDPEPIGRFNVAPGTRVLLLSERDEQLGSAWKKESMVTPVFATPILTTSWLA
ncbi:Gifsy-2 prophage protein [Klebsiella pneumoniae]|nr:Gifsy-2 prophage protein [Klebsiella pneumoniae]